MDLTHVRMLIRELMNKDSDIVLDKAPLIIFYSKYNVCMAKNGKDNKQTRHISRRVHFLRTCEKCKIKKIDWFEGGIKL